MILTTLVENSRISEEYINKHGLCIHLKTKKHNILISGCSHTGILNILKEVEEKLKIDIYVAIGGLHLYNPINKKSEDISFINELGNKLLDKNIKIYTCHCTGLKAFDMLKNILDNNIRTIKTGQVIELKNDY